MVNGEILWTYIRYLTLDKCFYLKRELMNMVLKGSDRFQVNSKRP